MKAHPVNLSNGITKFMGHMVVDNDAIVFLCTGKGSALLENAGIGAGGVIGSVLKALSGNDSGDLPAQTDSASLRMAAAEMPGSIVFEAAKIEKIVDGWFLKGIWWDKKKIGAPHGFPKPLKVELATWAQHHGVATKGL